MTIIEKAAYLKGLAQGLKLDSSTKEGELLTAIVDLLNDMALTFDDIESELDEFSELVDIIDEDLGNVEQDIYGDDDDDDYEEELYEVVCPSCGDTVCLDADMLSEGSIDCPGCGELLEFDLEECCCDDECDCDCKA